MNRCIKVQDCICQDYNSIPKECINRLEIRDSGKSIKLSLKKKNEKAIVIVIDDCLITKGKRCDALFLYQGNRKLSILVELKGFGDIEKAFEQLAFTKQRNEYKDIIECFEKIDNKKVKTLCFIVTNGKLDNSKKENLENLYKIRVKQVLTNEATKPVPDLRYFI